MKIINKSYKNSTKPQKWRKKYEGEVCIATILVVVSGCFKHERVQGSLHKPFKKGRNEFGLTSD